MKLSIVIPVYNEVDTIEKVIERVMDTPHSKELIIVDDCSTDGTRELLGKIKTDGINIYYHDKNQGKGAALRTGFKIVQGDIVIIQDADMEYDPNDYAKLLEPIMCGKAEVVYGSRFLSDKHLLHCKKFFYITHFLGNKFLNILLNLLYNSKVTDMETCYKVMTKEALDSINLTESRFEIEPAITANLLLKGYNVYEVPISYSPRDYKEGKKVTWRDGIIAIYVLFKYRFKRGN
jgi:glycosyltransferase involved in cell wall biosynthesis